MRELRNSPRQRTAARLSLTGSVLLGLLLIASWPAAHAQSINQAWLGRWKLERSNLTGTPTLMRVERGDGGQTVLVSKDESCPLRYDGLVTPSEIAQRVQALRSMQLDPQYWPPGTQTNQLVGLIREFDEAQKVLDSLPQDSYRRLRADCASVPSDKADRFFVLRDGKHLFEFGFPVGALGLWAERYSRAR